jgi:hypothetical protein
MSPPIGLPVHTADTGVLSWIVPPIVLPAVLGAMVLIWAFVRAHM